MGRTAFSQVGIGTSSPNSSAILDLASSNKGFLMPRLNLIGRDDTTTITSPANGLMVVNMMASGTGTNTVSGNSVYFWQNSLWQKFTTLTEITVLKQTSQYVVRSVETQAFTASQLTSINSDENFEVPIVWSSNEISIDNPSDIELTAGNNNFRIKTSGNYSIASNFSFNPQRKVSADNSNYTYVAFSVSKSTNNGSSWTTIAGAATPYDIGVSNQIQTIIIPRTILHFNAGDLIRIVISQPGSTTPDYGENSGILQKSNGDYTKYLRITRIYNVN